MEEEQYFIHVNVMKSGIVGVSRSAGDTENAEIKNVPIDKELAHKLLTGEENITNWNLVKNADDSYSLVKHIPRNSRIESLPFVEINGAILNADIKIVMDTKKKFLRISIMTEKIRAFENEVVIYLTKFEDPSSLITSIKVRSVDKMHIKKTKLIKFDNLENVSIFMFKLPLNVSLERI